VVHVDERLDLAVLAVPGLRRPPLRTAPAAGGLSLRVVRGDRVRALPAALRRAITAHVRDAPGSAAAVRPALELAAPVADGDSRAPVTDGRGRVTGVVFARSHDRARTAFAVEASVLLRLLRGASAGGQAVAGGRPRPAGRPAVLRFQEQPVPSRAM